MTALRAVTAAAGEMPLPAEGRGQAGVLAGRLEAAFLAEAGWDPETRVLTIDPAHPLLGRRDRKSVV